MHTLNTMSRTDESPRLGFESFELDLQTDELSRDGHRIRLQDQPARLLALLATRPGELVTREEIQKEIWDGQFVEFDHAINTAVRKIREALDDDPQHPRLIETLPRKGYRFIGTVEPVPRVPDLPDGGDQNPRSATETFTLPSHFSRPLFFFIQAGYLAMYTGTLYYLVDVENVLSRLVPISVSITLPIVIVTAMCGIAVRLYLVSSVGWRHPEAGAKFERLFPALLLLDGLWAASPLLLAHRMGVGIALAGVAGLAYTPFSQRTLVRSLYPRHPLAR